MKKCESCGNEYKAMFQVIMPDHTHHWFDSFECAAHKLAPRCTACNVLILGHGVEVGEHTFCSAHCARAKGFTSITDHSEQVLVSG